MSDQSLFPPEPADEAPSLFAQVTASLIRSWVNAGAGALATAGVLTQEQGMQFATVGVALLTWAANYCWSVLQKRQAQARLKAAVAAPAGLSRPTAGRVS